MRSNWGRAIDWSFGLQKSGASATMSSMKINRQGGYIDTLVAALISVSVLLVAAASFGLWSFISRQDYKNNSDEKAAVAAAASKKATQTADAIKYAEAAKNPLKIHAGPSQFGSVSVAYPKTWSGYVSESGRGSQPVDDYFHPDVVPNVTIDNGSQAYALRIQVVDQPYDTVIDQFSGPLSNGKVTASPYALPKVPDVVGTRFEGQVEKTKLGIMIVVPLRNMTLKVWTESSNYVTDFNEKIIPNFTFAP
jgi:hypothetical protein